MLCRPIYCPKSLDSTLKSVQLYALPYVPQNQFFCSPIETRTFSESSGKGLTGCQPKNVGLYCRFKQYKCAEVEMWGEKLMNKSVFRLFFLCPTPLFVCSLHIQDSTLCQETKEPVLRYLVITQEKHKHKKTQHVKIVCLKLNKIQAQIIKWNSNFIFFHPS